MQGQGEPGGAAKPVGGMPATDDEIREKYLERAIRELNHFTRDLQACDRCPRGNLMPVLGSGHPQADVFLLKYAPTPAEIEEGVAFYGRAGTALMKSLKRLDIDPLAVYGTLCVKCPVRRHLARRAGVRRAAGRGDRDRAAEDRRGHGAGGARRCSTSSQLPLAREVARPPGEIQPLTPSIDALYTPNIDDALDEESRQARVLDARSACSATGTRTSRRTEPPPTAA